VAVILHGSRARGDATPGSDVALLAVVEPHVGLSRQ
jgi:predicted nucleotidyltransferase